MCKFSSKQTYKYYSYSDNEIDQWLRKRKKTKKKKRRKKNKEEEEEGEEEEETYLASWKEQPWDGNPTIGQQTSNLSPSANPALISNMWINHFIG